MHEAEIRVPGLGVMSDSESIAVGSDKDKK
jgi:hypothetical protein